MSIRRTLLGLLMFVDNVGHLAHMHARDSSFALVSRAPWKQIAPGHGAHLTVRPPGGMGGLARGMAANRAVAWWRLHDEYDLPDDQRTPG